LRKVSVLMVCTANICRSPMAAGLMVLHAERAGLARSLVVHSAGTHVRVGGQKPDARALRAAAAVGVDLGRARSRQLEPKDYERHDYLIGMDERHRSFLLGHCPANEAYKVALVMDFALDAAAPEVPDPYFGNYAGFERVLALLDSGVQGLLRHIRERHFA